MLHNDLLNSNCFCDSVSRLLLLLVKVGFDAGDAAESSFTSETTSFCSISGIKSNFQTDQIGRGKSCMSKVDRKSATNFQLCSQISHICSVSANLWFDLLDTVGSNVNMRVKTLHFHVKQPTDSIALEIEKRVGGTFSITPDLRIFPCGSYYQMFHQIQGRAYPCPEKKTNRSELSYPSPLSIFPKIKQWYNKKRQKKSHNRFQLPALKVLKHGIFPASVATPAAARRREEFSLSTASVPPAPRSLQHPPPSPPLRPKRFREACPRPGVVAATNSST